MYCNLFSGFAPLVWGYLNIITLDMCAEMIDFNLENNC
jgi:hypothetical protein